MRIYHPKHGILHVSDQVEIKRLLETGGEEFNVHDKPWERKELGQEELADHDDFDDESLDDNEEVVEEDLGQEEADDLEEDLPPEVEEVVQQTARRGRKPKNGNK